MGVVSRQVKGDLKRSKEFVESREHATGAWRGEIHGQDVEHRPDERHDERDTHGM